MATNVPTIVFSPTGPVVPAQAAVLAGAIADINQAFGGNLNFTTTTNAPINATPQAQLASSETAVIGDNNDALAFVISQFDPAYATGRYQDALARISFLERNAAEPTVLQVLCTGDQDVVIPAGSLVRDTSNNLYASTQDGTIPAGGTITIPFAAVVPGPTPIPGGSQIQIYQLIGGWDSVSVVSGEVGSNVEGRYPFEARRQATVAGNSFGAIGSIIGAVAKTPGVTDYYGYDNDEPTPVTVNGVTIAANSIYICVAGGATAAAVAQAIWSKKSPGCNYTGNTTVVVQDTNPLYALPYPEYNVSFEVPSDLEVLFAVQILNSPQVPANATALIQQAIIDAFAGNDGGERARIGATLFATRYVPPVVALGAWAQVISLDIGSNNTSSALFTAYIIGTVMHVTAVASGTLAAGQTVSDLTGALPVGTTIASLGSGTGGTGTYNLSSSTNVGATFTGSGSGTNLTTTSVTGTIAIGQTVVGSGVPANTTIVSQTSGPAGGAGVYVTSAVTTASTAALSSGEIITAALANNSSVTVLANQEPVVAAANIQVTFI